MIQPNWHQAFFRGTSVDFARRVGDYMENNWDYEVAYSGGRIYSVMDSDGDYVAHRDDYDNDEEMLGSFVDYCNQRMLDDLDNRFGFQKNNVKIGAMTKIPFPKYNKGDSNDHTL